MKLKVILLLVTTALLCSSISFPSNNTTTSINFEKDFDRLAILQYRYQNSNNAVDRYNYSSAMVDYLEEMTKRVKEVNSIYYRPAILILTGETRKDTPSQDEINNP